MDGSISHKKRGTLSHADRRVEKHGRTATRLLSVIALSVLLLLLLSIVAQAAGGRRWTAAGVPVAGLPEFDEISPRSCSDGSGGFIVAWLADGGTDNVYVQRFNSGGTAQWTAGGVKLTNNIAGGQGFPQVVTDDNHGAIVCWMDNGSGAMQVYGVHVLAAGTIDTNWNGGTPVVAASSGGALDINTFTMSRDGSGGALLAYGVTQVAANEYMYAQRISAASGAQSYGVGRQVKSDVADEDQEFPRIMPAGTTGAVVAFTGDGAGGSPKAYIQRMDDLGFPTWNQPGGALTVSNRTSSYPGGLAFIDTTNFVVAFSGSEDVGESVCLQKFDASGTKLWDVAGIKLDNPGGLGGAIPQVFCNSGSVFVLWYHASDEAGAGVWAQKVNSSGTALWTAGGVLLSNTIPNSFAPHSAWPSFTTDGMGGAIFCWTDTRTGTANIFTQRLSSAGAAQWGTGMAACTQNSAQSEACLVSDSSLGAILAWEDQRVTPGIYDIFAQRVSNAAPTFSSVSPNRSLTNNNTTLVINGANFLPGVHAKARLHGSGTYTVAPTNTYVSSTRMNAVFNFEGFTPGAYDLGIWNNDGQVVWAENVLTLGTAPHITGVSSTSTYPGGPAITVNGTNFTTAGTLVFNSVPATSITSWTNTQIVVQAPEGSSSGPLTVTTEWGTSNEIQMTLTTPEQHLAEGSNAWGYSTDTTVVNTTSQTMHFLYEVNVSGNPLSVIPTWSLDLQPLSSLDLSAEKLSVIPTNTGDLVNLEGLDFSANVISVIPPGSTAGLKAVETTKSVFADRTMEWRGKDAPSDEITASIGATTTAEDWFMPEGSSNWGFETYTLVQNPGDKKATLIFTYMVEGEGPKTFTHTVPAKSRATFNMEQDIGKKDASIKVSSDKGIICERAMYRNDKREGHDSVGATRATNDYYLAEGTTAWGFTSYVLIQNPNSKATDVTLTFMTEDGPRVMKTFRMPAGTRKTVRVNDVTPANGEEIDMSSCDFSTKVHGNRPIIAERAMYWGKDTVMGEATHDSIGTPMPHKVWVLGDGEASDERGKTETYTLVQNPNSKPVNIEIVYMTPGDTQGGKQPNKTITATIKANSRKTFNMGDYIKGRAATKVTCTTKDMKIIVERAMYINNRGGGSDTIGAFND